MYNPEMEYLYYECLLIILEETRGFKLEILRLKECSFLIPLIKTDVFFLLFNALCVLYPVFENNTLNEGES